MSKSQQSPWITTAKLAQELGLSSRSLLRSKKNLNLKEGTHYLIVNPAAVRKTYRWNRRKVLQKFKIRTN